MALFTFAGRISAKREAPDVAIFDESMAKAPQMRRKAQQMGTSQPAEN
jgi:hypothetical protein